MKSNQRGEAFTMFIIGLSLLIVGMAKLGHHADGNGADPIVYTSESPFELEDEFMTDTEHVLYQMNKKENSNGK